MDYYEKTHVPIANKIPDLVRWTWGKCLPGGDGSAPPYFFSAELVWDSIEAMGAAMSSADGAAAGADVANFATGGVTMLVSEGH
ncbi:MAG: EthD family reductase [Acidimicrobiales bacterium]